MRILVVNKFWYARGGDCVVAMATARLLRTMGHDVAIFSMHHPDNVPCDDDKGFANQVHFDGNFIQKVKAVKRSLGDKEVCNAFTAALQRFNPNVVHLHNIHSYLSPVVAQLAHNHGCRVVWTMHDYKLFCSSYSCLRDGKPCQSCIDHPTDVVTHRCMKNSLAASIAALFESTKWNLHKLTEWVDVFICPSQFMAAKMENAGFPKEKLTVINNFLPDERRDTSPVAMGRAEYCCYAGRLSKEKGVETLLKASSSLPFTLKIAGDGPLLKYLVAQYGNHNNVEFLGRLDNNEINKLLRLARFSVMPSQWWENNPLSAIESLCAGTPVVGTDIGGIPELIDSQNGMLVPVGDFKTLAQTMQQAWNKQWDYAAIARHAAAKFSPTAHYKALINAYNP